MWTGGRGWQAARRAEGQQAAVPSGPWRPSCLGEGQAQWTPPTPFLLSLSALARSSRTDELIAPLQLTCSTLTLLTPKPEA